MKVNKEKHQEWRRVYAEQKRRESESNAVKAEPGCSLLASGLIFLVVTIIITSLFGNWFWLLLVIAIPLILLGLLLLIEGLVNKEIGFGDIGVVAKFILRYIWNQTLGEKWYTEPSGNEYRKSDSMGGEEPSADTKPILSDEQLAELYAELYLTPEATDQEVKRAYRRMAKKYHPDKLTGYNKSEYDAAVKRFRNINEVYSLIQQLRSRTS